MQEVLKYKQWRYFEKAIKKAEEACENSMNVVADHFAEVRKMVKLVLLLSLVEKTIKSVKVWGKISASDEVKKILQL